LTPLLFISIDLLVILYVFYPISRRRRDFFVACLLALIFSFVLSIIRLAIMALVVNDAPKFDYWHGSPGSNLFMTICLVSCGLYAISRMPAKQSETLKNNKPLPPLANPEWIIKGFLLVIAVMLIFLILRVHGGSQRLANFQFPESIPLPGWQFVRSEPLSTEEMAFFLKLEAEEPIADLLQKVEQAQLQQEGSNILMSGRRYSLWRDSSGAEMTLTYVLNSDATFPNFGNNGLSQSTYELAMQNVRQTDANVPYLVVNDVNKTHLISCLTEGGKGVTTRSSMPRANRIRDRLSTPQGIYKWMTGQSFLHDRRCVWVHLSEDAVGSPGEKNRLVEVWQGLQNYWSNNFPSL
jgi:cyanosortase A-associated protein